MTPLKKAHFAQKHPPGTKPDPQVAAALTMKMQNQTITCAQAHELAASLGVGAGVVGMAIDLAEGRIHKCQLGLFGYPRTWKIVKPAQNLAPDIAAVIQSTAADHRLTCSLAWEIADRMQKSRLFIANACEALEIRITRCQLGAF